MYKIYISNTDVTNNVERGTLKITENLNNRRNTANFSLIDFSVTEGQKVEIYKGSFIESLDADPKKIFVDDIFKYEERYFTGQEIILNIKGTEEKKIIDTIDTTEGSIVFTEDIIGSYVKGDTLAIKIFGGTVLTVPDQNIGKSDIFLDRVNAVDYSSIFDSEVAVESFENQYPREIIGRSIYEFASTDSEELVNEFDDLTGITSSGVATAPALEGEDVISGNFSLKIGATGPGTAIYTIIAPIPFDITNQEHARGWLRVPESIEQNLTSLVVKFGNDSSNYLRYDKTYTSGDYWSYEALVLSEGIEVGSVDKTQINYFSFEFLVTSAIPSGDILLDDLRFSIGGFTLKNTARGTVKFEDARANYKKMTVFIESIAKNIGFFRYIDYDKDLHFFNSEKKLAPFSLSPTSGNYGEIKRTIDLSKLKNRQTVRGGQAPTDNRYIQENIVDGVEESWRLDYPPKDLKVYVDITGVGDAYVEKTVGVENLVDEATVDYIYSFSEKITRRTSDSVIPANGLFKQDYLPYKDIRVRYQDKASIEAMKAITGGNGVYDGAVINDKEIKTFTDARTRARAEISAYKNPLITINFDTEKENLQAGQLIQITDPSRGIDDSFLIQKVGSKSKDEDRFTYFVTAASTLFGYIEFFQLLFKKAEEGLVDVNELVDVVLNIDEVLSFEEEYTLTKKTTPFYAMGPTPNETPNDAYADYSETS